MGAGELRNVLDAAFRARSCHRLIPAARLPRPVARALGAAWHDADFYGVLAPRGRAPVDVRAIGRATAWLLGAVRRPGPLPTAVRRALGADANDTVARLVLDGLLEIEDGRAFVSGADAYRRVFDGAPAVRPRGQTARLSIAALRHGAHQALGDATALSARLYRYNSVPASPRWRRLLPAPDAVAAWLGGDLVREGPWLVSRLRPTGGHPRPAEARLKLYVSPSPAFAGDALRRALRVLARSPAVAFKVGGDLYGLLRPDKLVAYFTTRDALRETAAALRPDLAGMTAQGVPFTASLTPGGLLSWGLDPPREDQSLGPAEQESWRFWIAIRAATALVAARRAAELPVSPWIFALQRLRLEGIDIESFAPSAARRQRFEA